MTSRIEVAAEASLTHQLKALNKMADHMSGALSRKQLGLRYPEVTIVGVVGTFGPQTVMDISRLAGFDKSQTSRAVAAMVARGILTRAGNDKDGRSMIISLTSEGGAIFRNIGPVLHKRDDVLYSSLSETERMALRHLLDKVLSSHGCGVAS